LDEKKSLIVEKISNELGMGGGQVSCRVTFHRSILTLLIIPSSPISTSVKTYLKTFFVFIFALLLPQYEYHNSSFIPLFSFSLH
jgi:hypothetical protein